MPPRESNSDDDDRETTEDGMGEGSCAESDDAALAGSIEERRGEEKVNDRATSADRTTPPVRSATSTSTTSTFAECDARLATIDRASSRGGQGVRLCGAMRGANEAHGAGPEDRASRDRSILGRLMVVWCETVGPYGT